VKNYLKTKPFTSIALIQYLAITK